MIVQPQRMGTTAFYKYNGVSKGTGLGKHELHVASMDLKQRLAKPEIQGQDEGG